MTPITLFQRRNRFILVQILCMFRKQAVSKKKQNSDHITWRGHEITRIEAFSDAVFAFAVTLLIMSLEVPHDYEELAKDLGFILPFGICFGITMMVWYQQNMFFRRFGLHDFVTIALNGVLLFSVLVYMFPLKFLIGSTFQQGFNVHTPQQAANIFSLYSGGFACFYLLFTLMYINAYFKRHTLNLTDGEAFAALSNVYSHLSIAIVSIISVVIAMVWGPLDGKYLGYAGMSYALIGLIMPVLTYQREKMYKERFQSEEVKLIVTHAGHEIPKELDVVADDEAN
jgi:uncharacterized membrane protein